MTPVTDFIAHLAEPERSVLMTLHTIVHERLPDVIDSWSYNLPTYRYKGKILFSFGKTKTFLSLYPGPEAVSRLKDQLGDYVLRKATISFAPEHPLPNGLIHQLISIRVTHIEKSI